jgi:hypothetical protein
MSTRRGHAVIWLSVSFILIVLFAAAPLISALIAGGIADALGCTLNEGGASGCLFRGADIGQTLAELFVLGWLSFVTLPIGLAALAIWFVVACLIAFIGWRRRRREAQA